MEVSVLKVIKQGELVLTGRLQKAEEALAKMKIKREQI